MIKGLHSEIKKNQNKIVETLTKIFGSNAALQIEIDSIKSLINEKTIEKAEKTEVGYI